MAETSDNPAPETIADLMPQTPDLLGERLATLRELFPDLFDGEGGLLEKELRALADPSYHPAAERYEFSWTGKTRSKREAFAPSRAALVYDAKRSVNPDKAGGNVIIEGENLEVLKQLTAAYRERVKLIYIDPPYNTGKDFVYSDDYTEGRKPYWEQSGVTERGVKVDTNSDSEGRFHSNWLSMMHARLLAARYLLREDGVIFISIGDQEVANLRRLMDTVFGEEHFITQFIWEKKKKPSFLDKSVGGVAEYVICYGRSEKALYPLSVAVTTAGKRTPLNNAGNSERTLTFPAGRVQFMIEDGTVKAQDMSEGNIVTKLLDDVTVSEGRNVASFRLKGEFRYSQDKLDEVLASGDAITISKVPFRPNHIKAGGEPKKMKNLLSISHYQVETYEDASAEIVSLFGDSVFDYAKPPGLISLLIAAATYEEPDALILDFFGGSGTTAQAVMDLNADGGNRRFILVQLPEFTKEDSAAYKAGYKKISDITIERNKRVIDRYRKEAEGLLPTDPKRQYAGSLGFRVYTLEKSHFPRVDFAPDPEKTEAENVELLRAYIKEKENTFARAYDRERILDEVLLKNGFMFDRTITPASEFKKNKVEFVQDAHRTALICLDASIAPETVDEFDGDKDRTFICLEAALDTTKKWNLKHHLGDRLRAV